MKPKDRDPRSSPVVGASSSLELTASAGLAALMARAASRKIRAALPRRPRPLTVIGAVLHSTLLSNA